MSEMIGKYDLVIVGAGPAGSTAAFHVENLKTLIIDRSDFPRPKACGGGLMSSQDWPREFENFRRIDGKLTRFPCSSIRFFWNKLPISNRRFRHLFDQVDRQEFDNLLLEEALKKDNVSFLRFDLEKIEEATSDGERGFILRGKEGKIFARRLIGADGMYSQVSKFLGNPLRERHQYGSCLEYEFSCQKIHQDVIVVPGFEGEIGYGWVFPTKKGYLVGIGLTRQTKKSILQHLDSFLGWAVEKGLLPKDRKLENLSGAPIPLSVVKKYAEQKVMLVGDAMGLVKVLTGEGIYYAMKSGKLAGEIASRNPDDFREYRKVIRPIVREVFLTPHIPPKIFTITFWSVFFRIGKRLEKIGRLNPIINHFIRSAVHRSDKDEASPYFKEKIARF